MHIYISQESQAATVSLVTGQKMALDLKFHASNQIL